MLSNVWPRIMVYSYSKKILYGADQPINYFSAVWRGCLFGGVAGEGEQLEKPWGDAQPARSNQQLSDNA
jgi:hypothetical protein